MQDNLNGIIVSKSFHKLPVWTGKPIIDTYGNKPVLNYNGKPLFAELYALKMYKDQGYDGVWADTFRKIFRTELPENHTDEILLPKIIKNKLSKINPDGKMSGTWDLILWKKNQLKFVELKRKGKDKIRSTQIEFLEKAINCGLQARNFEIFEWELNE